jgi:putative ABC transport system permease protein
MWQDFKFACRTLRKARSFTVVTALMLALGIGANTAVFSIVFGALLRPLPYRDPQNLVDVLDESRRESRLSKLFDSYADFRAYREHARSFEGIAAATWAIRAPILSGHGTARRVTAIPVSDGFFALLGVRPALGRDVTPEEAHGCAVVLSHSFWAESLGSDRSIVGRSLALDGESCTVTGVMPRGFSFYPAAAELWRVESSDIGAPVFIIGRLFPGVSLMQAQAELAGLHAGIEHRDAIERQFTPAVTKLQDDFTWLAGRNLRTTLWALLGAVGLVLLIACLNIANLLSGRALGRSRELAMRMALGGGRARVVRLLLIEGLLLAACGGALGIALAEAAVRYFRAANPVELPIGAEITVSAPALLFTLLVSLATVLLFALAPAWRSSRVDLNRALKAGGRGGVAGGDRSRVARAMVAAEMALSVTLLAGAGLLMESVLRMGSEPLGFEPRGLYTAGISLPVRRYADPAARLRFLERFQAAILAKPGVRSAAVGSAVPPYYAGNNAVEILGKPVDRDAAVHDAGQQWIDPAYLGTLGIQLRRGRTFDAHDQAGTTPVAIIDEALEREYFGAADPLGQRIRIADGGDEAPWAVVVGVVATVKRSTVFQEMNWIEAPTVYRPLTQQTPAGVSLALRPQVGAGPLRAAVAAALAETDPEAAIGSIEPVETSLARILAYPRFRAAVFGGFAAFALLLAAAGLHGVLSQLVARRTQEIGVRMALGATQSDILRLVFRQGSGPVLGGLAAGIVIALTVARWLSSLLYGIRLRDPLMFGGVGITLLLAAAIATAAPARRAARTDPLDALRQE